MISEYKKAIEKLLARNDLSCRQFFRKHGYTLELAYCELLDDNLEEAYKLFEFVKDNDIRAHWGMFMISLIRGDVKEYPSYFELRNFLEIDLNILINYFKGNYVENIIRYADFMFTINPEVHKFIGRVLYNNRLKDNAMFFLNRAKDYFYNDPELHYLLAYIYYQDKDYANVQTALDNCLYILPDYYPAVSMKRKLLNKI